MPFAKAMMSVAVSPLTPTITVCWLKTSDGPHGAKGATGLISGDMSEAPRSRLVQV